MIIILYCWTRYEGERWSIEREKRTLVGLSHRHVTGIGNSVHFNLFLLLFLWWFGIYLIISKGFMIAVLVHRPWYWAGRSSEPLENLNQLFFRWFTSSVVQVLRVKFRRIVCRNRSTPHPEVFIDVILETSIALNSTFLFYIRDSSSGDRGLAIHYN